MINSSVKRSQHKLDMKKIVKLTEQLSKKIKAGYPKENSISFDEDANGFSALDKALSINFSDTAYRPYMRISFKRNEAKYKAELVKIAKLKTAQKILEAQKALGAQMVADIKEVLLEYKLAPKNDHKGSIDSSISYTIKKA